MSDSPNRRNEHLWGQSTHLFMSEQADLAVAHGHAGGASSFHTHLHKANTFIVDWGVVEIRTYMRTVRLEAGQSHTVAACVGHRMFFVTDARLFEFYHAKSGETIDLDDIRRISDGWRPGEGPDAAKD